MQGTGDRPRRMRLVRQIFVGDRHARAPGGERRGGEDMVEQDQPAVDLRGGAYQGVKLLLSRQQLVLFHFTKHGVLQCTGRADLNT